VDAGCARGAPALLIKGEGRGTWTGMELGSLQSMAASGYCR
jgi:hypothetical protein